MECKEDIYLTVLHTAVRLIENIVECKDVYGFSVSVPDGRLIENIVECKEKNVVVQFFTDFD